MDRQVCGAPSIAFNASAHTYYCIDIANVAPTKASELFAFFYRFFSAIHCCNEVIVCYTSMYMDTS